MKGLCPLLFLQECLKRFQKHLTIHLKMIIMDVDVYTIKTEEKNRMKKIGFTKGIVTLMMVLITVVALVACNQKSDQAYVDEALDSVVVTYQTGDSAESVTKNLTLPTTVGVVTITWSSSAPAVISNAGVVTRGNANQAVTLTATISYGDASETKTFEVTVIATPDTIAPAFLGLVNGKLPKISHLETLDVDFMSEVVARDNRDGYDVVIEVILGDYDKNNPGDYVISYTATDKSNNTTTVQRDVTVIDALDVTVDAARIGNNWIPFVYNQEDAFKFDSVFGGATFRQQDVLHVMSKTFFDAQVLEHGSEYASNNNLPLLPYGSLIVTDKDYNIIHARFQTGVYLQLDVVDGATVLTHTDVIWNNGAGGDLFKGISDIIPADGYVMFISPIAPQAARIFLVSNLFYSGYTGGAVTKDLQDIFELTNIELVLEEDYRVLIPMPDPIATPEIVLNRHSLSWAAIPNALNYQLFVDGVAFGNPIAGTSIDLSALDLALSTNDGYIITVVANTKDQFKWSSSVESNEILYKKVEIQTLSAPNISVDTENAKRLTWEAVEGTDYYEVYVKLGAFLKLVATTEENSFDVSVVSGFNGVNGYVVKGIGLATHTDSINSNVAFIDQTVVTMMTFDGMSAPVVITNATDYFNRRNLTDASKLGNYLYLVTDIKAVEAWSGIYTEAFGTVVVLDANYQAKFVRNILAKQTYIKGTGWFDDATYAANNAQLVGLGAQLAEGDMLLIGKNGLTVSTVVNGNAATVAARDFIAYHFVNPWVKFPATTASAADGGWRAPMTSFKDASTTVVAFAQTV
jgi:hypothetical protein